VRTDREADVTIVTRHAPALLALAAAVSSVFITSGCAPQTADASGEVVAVVNDQKLSAAQLDQVLRETSSDPATAEQSRHALDTLIDEELLVQSALDNELEADPDVANELARARRRILANAYAERHIYTRSLPDPAEVGNYYREHPALFAERRTYQIAAFTVSSIDVPSSVQRELRRDRGTVDVRRVLEGHHVRFETELLRKTAEQLPLDQLPVFAKASAGDVLVVPGSGGKESLLSLTAIERTPVTFEQAQPLIEQYLVSTRNRAALDGYLKDAKDRARIQYPDNATSGQSLLASNAARSKSP
jgi:EpsD family peptidyl-prolyl cis-trans isomerase